LRNGKNPTNGRGTLSNDTAFVSLSLRIRGDTQSHDERRELFWSKLLGIDIDRSDEDENLNDSVRLSHGYRLVGALRQ
jgi:hypothetical protein